MRFHPSPTIDAFQSTQQWIRNAKAAHALVDKRQKPVSAAVKRPLDIDKGAPGAECGLDLFIAANRSRHQE